MRFDHIPFDEYVSENVNKFYESSNFLPMGVTHHKGRLFLTFPRRRPNVPATIGYIDLISAKYIQDSPPVFAYPDYKTHAIGLDLQPFANKRIVSVYRTRVDKCERMWFVDTGYLECKYLYKLIILMVRRFWIYQNSRFLRGIKTNYSN